jgi:hypothetical protein
VRRVLLLLLLLLRLRLLLRSNVFTGHRRMI